MTRHIPNPEIIELLCRVQKTLTQYRKEIEHYSKVMEALSFIKNNYLTHGNTQNDAILHERRGAFMIVMMPLLYESVMRQEDQKKMETCLEILHLEICQVKYHRE